MIRAANSPAPVAAAAGVDRLHPFHHEGDQSLAAGEAIDARDVEVLLRLEWPELVQSLRIGFEGPAVAAIVEEELTRARDAALGSQDRIGISERRRVRGLRQDQISAVAVEQLGLGRRLAIGARRGVVALS